MKEKVLVTYSVQYCKEIELEITEEIKECLDKGEKIDWEKHCSLWDNFITINNDILFELKIPTLYSYDSKFGQEFEEVEYIDGSFDIETFEKQL